MQLKWYHIIVTVLVAFFLGWFLGPNNETIVNRINKSDYQLRTTDTVTKYVPFQIEKIVYRSIKANSIKDTIYVDTVDRTYVADLVAEYECLTQKLIDQGFERIKNYEKITPNGDSIYIELESVKDLILKAELKLAVREIPTQSYNSYYEPKPATPEAWYIKPAIGLSGLAIGYALGGIK